MILLILNILINLIFYGSLIYFIKFEIEVYNTAEMYSYVMYGKPSVHDTTTELAKHASKKQRYETINSIYFLVMMIGAFATTLKILFSAIFILWAVKMLMGERSAHPGLIKVDSLISILILFAILTFKLKSIIELFL